MGAERTRFSLWLILLLVIVLAGGWQWQRGVMLETDILALLPQGEREPLLQRALTRSSQQGEGLVLWLVSGDDRSAAIAGASWLEQRLAAAPELTPLMAAEPARTQRLAAHRYHLLPPAEFEQLRDDPQAWLADKRAALYGPAGWQRAAQLRQDPLFLHGDYLLSLVPDSVTEDGYALHCTEKRCHAALVSRLAGSNFALDDQARLRERVAALTTAAGERGLEVTAGGLPLFVAEATARAQREIRIVGSGSLLGIALLLLWSFRTGRPLLLAVSALATGIGAAALVCFTVFERVHVLTLVFGASLVGVAIDYALHWLTNCFREQGESALDERRLLRATGLALFTTALGFGLLALAPFPGLRQLALFAVVGLSGAWLTVALAFPLLGRGLAPLWRPALAWPQRAASAWATLGRRHWTWLVGAACILLAGIARLEPSDDLRLLQPKSPADLSGYARMQRLVPMSRDSQFFLVRGASPGQVLAGERRLLAALEPQSAALGDAMAISEYYPAPSIQRATREALQDLCNRGDLAAWLKQVGATTDLAATTCANIDAANDPLALEAWLKAVGEPWQGLWLGCVRGTCASLVALSGVRDLGALRGAAEHLDGVTLVDPLARVSTVLGEYRRNASRWLGLALVLIAPLLMGVLGPGRGLRAALVPALTVGSVLATLGWLGLPFSLFNLLALLVVGGISVDYAIFNAVGGRHPATALAVVLAALTTVLAFGLLALSHTPLVAAFGLTLAWGVFYAVLWTPVLAGPGARREGSVEA